MATTKKKTTEQKARTTKIIEEKQKMNMAKQSSFQVILNLHKMYHNDIIANAIRGIVQSFYGEKKGSTFNQLQQKHSHGDTKTHETLHGGKCENFAKIEVMKRGIFFFKNKDNCCTSQFLHHEADASNS